MARVEEKAGRLEQFFDHILRCRVVVEAPHRHHHRGKLYSVGIEISVPGKHLVVNHAGPSNHAHEDVYVAIRDAFKAATRQLEDHVRTVRGKVKFHEVPPHGRVLQIFPEEGHGIVQTADGQEVFFNRSSVPNGGFDDLEVGTEVRITLALEEHGKQFRAQHVHPVGKHHLIDP